MIEFFSYAFLYLAVLILINIGLIVKRVPIIAFVLFPISFGYGLYCYFAYSAEFCLILVFFAFISLVANLVDYKRDTFKSKH
jgi:hypothetical protein